MQKIEEIVGEVLDAMRRRGLREYTLKHENWSIYRPIINWHHKNGTEYYSEELLEGLCKHQQTRYENGEIQRKYYRSFITAAFRIRSYVDSGTVDFSIVKDARWFRPDEENQQIADSILENTGLKEGYRKKLSIPIRHLFCFIESRGKSIDQISEKDLLDFISEAAKTNRNNMNIVMRAVKSVSAYLSKQQLIKIEIDWDVFRPATSPLHLIAPYTQEEITRMLEVIESHSKTPLRDKAIILLAFNTGLRGVDIRKLKLADICWEKKEIHMVQSKTARPIAAPLQGKTLNALADYILQERPQCDSDCVFIRSYPAYTGLASTSPLDYMVDKYSRLAGIPKQSYRSFHSLRRAFGTELAEAEIPVTSISQMLGHRDMGSDKAYLSFNRSQTSLCSADFSEVPIIKGVYADITLSSSHAAREGGTVS